MPGLAHPLGMPPLPGLALQGDKMPKGQFFQRFSGLIGHVIGVREEMLPLAGVAGEGWRVSDRFADAQLFQWILRIGRPALDLC